jgi:3-dehydroquinate synthase
VSGPLPAEVPPAPDRVVVGLPAPERPYEVRVERGALGAVGEVLGDRVRVAVVSQAPVADHHARAVLDALGGRGRLFLIGDGEAAKSLATVEDLCRRFVRAGLARADAVVALGGGVVGDVAGFTAAVYHRGVDVVQCPTSLLAMVDAAIGGKTAVNLPEGKNLVGAFHQPLCVLADPDTLATLPAAEVRCGLGEVAKYACIAAAEGDPFGIAAAVAAQAEELRRGDPEALTDVVRRAAAMKAAVVAADPRETSGRRAVLNLGHTLGHALEAHSRFALTHGEAVAIGLVFALELAAALGRIDSDQARAGRAVVAALGLPERLPSGPAPAAGELVELMRRDKKAAGGLTFVLPGPDGIGRVEDPPPEALAAAFAAVGVEPPGTGA